MKLPRFDRARVLTIGDAMLDRYWHGDTGRMSAEAPIPVIDVNRVEDRPGGAANVALNVASLGARAALLAATGMDDVAEVLQRELESSDIEVRLIQAPDRLTTTKIRLVSRNQQMLRADFETQLHLDSDELLNRLENLQDYDKVILSDYDKGVLGDPQAVIAAVEGFGKPCLVDPKFKDFEVYAGAALLKPNKLELEYALGGWQSESEMISKCRSLMYNHGIKAVLVTRGGEGMMLIFPDGKEQHFPARTREVFDTSGAGDTVIAVIAAALGAGETLSDAVALSNIAAGIVVSHFGVTSVSEAELWQEIDPAGAADTGRMTAEQLGDAVRVARSRGEKIVFTNGCFDLLHAGHVNYLTQARCEGHRLVVAVNDDESVRRLKGDGRPINSLDRRMTMLAGLAAVDWVVSFPEDTPEQLLRSIRPDVLVKGGDYSRTQVVGADIVEAYGGVVKVSGLVEDCSTSALVEKIRELS